MRIFGLPQSMINELITVGPNFTERRVNKVLIAAGDEGGAMSVVHMGTINMAIADMNQAPDIALEIQSLSGLVEALRPVNARSYKGAADAGDIMQDLANDMGVAFERNGVSVILQNPYFPGTALEQVRSCAEAARIDYELDRGTLAIWNWSGSRKTDSPVRIAADTGMVGYPNFTSQGVAVRTLFHPDLVRGKNIQIDSSLTPANGIWTIYALRHALDSEVPNGQWFTDIMCQRAFQ